VGVAVLDRRTGRGTGAVAVFRRLVTNPLKVAAALGLVLAVTEVTVPRILNDPLRLIAGAAIPLMLMSFGAAPRLSLDPPKIGCSAVACACRNARMPLRAGRLGLV
jgi:malonate transporter and related proteins